MNKTNHSLQGIYFLKYASLLILTALVYSCGESQSSSEENKKVVSDEQHEVEPYPFEWTTADDLDFEKGEKIIVEGYLQGVVEIENDDLVLDVGPRRNSSSEAGIINILLGEKDSFYSGYDKIVTYKKANSYDSTEVNNFLIYLTNGDTLKTNELDRTKVSAQLKCTHISKVSERMTIYTFSADTMFVIPANLKDDFADAVPLTPKRGMYGKERKLSYCYIDGHFTVPPSVPEYSNGHSMPFKQDSGFYRVNHISIDTGIKELGKMKRLYDKYSSYSIKFYDTNLEVVGPNEAVRVYGVWDGMGRLSVEEFKRIGEPKENWREKLKEKERKK